MGARARTRAGCGEHAILWGISLARATVVSNTVAMVVVAAVLVLTLTVVAVELTVELTGRVDWAASRVLLLDEV